MVVSPAAPLSNKNGSEPDGCISVVIPVWRDHAEIITPIERLRGLPEIREIVVAAASPAPGLREKIEKLGAIFVESFEPNRGRQLNEGAGAATAEWLLFHHADTDLHPEHIRALAALNGSPAVGGAFYRKFDERHPRLRFLERIERWHSRTFGTLYGDQSLFVRRAHFRNINGFSPLPLMEDVDFSRRLRRSGKVRLLDPPVRSCPKAQIRRGPWKVTLRNLLFLILFRCGVPACHLHSWYYSLD